MQDIDNEQDTVNDLTNNEITGGVEDYYSLYGGSIDYDPETFGGSRFAQFLSYVTGGNDDESDGYLVYKKILGGDDTDDDSDDADVDDSDDNVNDSDSEDKDANHVEDSKLDKAEETTTVEHTSTRSDGSSTTKEEKKEISRFSAYIDLDDDADDTVAIEDVESLAKENPDKKEEESFIPNEEILDDVQYDKDLQFNPDNNEIEQVDSTKKMIIENLKEKDTTQGGSRENNILADTDDVDVVDAEQPNYTVDDKSDNVADDVAKKASIDELEEELVDVALIEGGFLDTYNDIGDYVVNGGGKVESENLIDNTDASGRTVNVGVETDIQGGYLDSFDVYNDIGDYVVNGGAGATTTEELPSLGGGGKPFYPLNKLSDVI